MKSIAQIIWHMHTAKAVLFVASLFIIDGAVST